MSRKSANPHLGHAKHNKRVCDYLNTEDAFCDWTVTVAFYSALHYVSHTIFPIEFTHKSGRKMMLQNVAAYKQANNMVHESKHTILCDLVRRTCPIIARAYERLLEMSYIARYENQRHSRAMADLARTKLKEIGEFCDPPVKK